MPDDAIERARECLATVIDGPGAHANQRAEWLRAGHDDLVIDARDALTALSLAFASQQAPEKAVKLAFTFAFARGFKTAEGTSRPCLPAMDEAWEDYAAMLDAAPSVTLGGVG